MPVGALGSSNRTQVRCKLEGEFPLNFGQTMLAGNGANLDVTGEALKTALTFSESKVLRDDRQVAGHTLTGVASDGTLNLEHRYSGIDRWVTGVLGDEFAVYGTLGVGTPIDVLTATSSTVLTATTAPTGTSAFTTLAKGQWFRIVPPVAATPAVKTYLRRRAFRVSPTVAPTATALTLDAATPFDTVQGGASLSLPRISSAKVGNGLRMWSYNLEVGHADIGAFRLYRGFIPGKLDWKVGDTGLITGSVGFVGKDMVDPLPTSTSMGTATAAPAYETASGVRGVFDIIENGVSISATTYIKSIDLMIDGTLRVQGAVAVLGAARITTGTFKVGGTMEVYFADPSLYNRFLSSTKTSLSLPIMDDLGNGYIYHICKATLTAVDVAAAGQDQDVMLKVNFSGAVDDDPASPTFGKTIIVYRVGDAI